MGMSLSPSKKRRGSMAGTVLAKGRMQPLKTKNLTIPFLETCCTDLDSGIRYLERFPSLGDLFLPHSAI